MMIHKTVSDDLLGHRGVQMSMDSPTNITLTLPVAPFGFAFARSMVYAVFIPQILLQ